MAFPTYTYTLTNGSTADATQVMQNYNDILNGVTDTTKDISVNAITAAGTTTLSGNVVLGNASSKTVTINGVLSSTFLVGANNSYDIGGVTTQGLRALYFSSAAAAHTTKLLGQTTATDINVTLPSTTSTLAISKNPTVQIFTATGTSTWTAPSGVTWIDVFIVGAGGGGGGGGIGSFNAATAGTASNFNGTWLVANGGGPGGQSGNAAGGTTSTGGSAINMGSFSGQTGGGSTYNGVVASEACGGDGGSTPLGGAGSGGSYAAAGTNAASNSGSGGGGGGANAVVACYSGAGGAAGGYARAIIGSPAASYSFTVGTKGAGAAAGSGTAGGNGADGFVCVTEYYY